MRCETLVFVFPSGGAFVIGDKNAAIENSVTFWSSQWGKENSLSETPEPPADFKGFSNTPVTPTSCGENWTARPGNSGHPQSRRCPPTWE